MAHEKATFQRDVNITFADVFFQRVDNLFCSPRLVQGASSVRKYSLMLTMSAVAPLGVVFAFVTMATACLDSGPREANYPTSASIKARPLSVNLQIIQSGLIGLTNQGSTHP